MNKDQKLFRDKFVEFAEELYNQGDKELLNLLRQQKIDRDKILNEVGMILLRYDIKDTSLNLSHAEYIKEYKNLDILISNVFESQYNGEKVATDKLLKMIAEDKYYSNSFLLSLGLDFKLNKMKVKDIKRILDATIEGKNYSDRIWSNKNKVAKVIKKEMKDFLQGNTNVNDIYKVVKDRFNQNAYITRRLVQNEVGRVQNEANELWAKDNGIEYQLFDATLDNKTTELCQSLDGTVYRADDPNKRIPNINTHVNCRSCLISLPNKDYKPRSRIDNISKKDINWTTYKEWKEMNI